MALIVLSPELEPKALATMPLSLTTFPALVGPAVWAADSARLKTARELGAEGLGEDDEDSANDCGDGEDDELSEDRCSRWRAGGPEPLSC